jgi:hypothetical protein
MFLMLGLILLSGAVISTYTGKTWLRLHGCIIRSKEPGEFWRTVAMYYLLGIGLLGYFLYEVG